MAIERTVAETMSTGAVDLGRQSDEAPTKTGVDAICRALDVVIASIALVVLAPLLAIIAVAIRVESRGPALFRQRRLGRATQPFVVYKFRTMRTGSSHDAHREFVLALIAGERPEAVAGGPRFKLAADRRITGVGRLLRRTSIDELPQLLNVIRGEMSLVGPRPPIPYEVERYPSRWLGRFAVKPGMTGLWQVSGRGELTFTEMIELDLEYVRRRSPLFNLWILVRTVPAVLSLRGAS
jgi:lipopolysaccharide/colanic/teichoic acid biosynthesis glycosyltransferase